MKPLKHMFLVIWWNANTEYNGLQPLGHIRTTEIKLFTQNITFTHFRYTHVGCLDWQHGTHPRNHAHGSGASLSRSWWRHHMETFSALLAFCAGNSPVPVNSPHKGQWRGALMFSLISAWTNSWSNNRDAGDLSRRRAHYDVTVMMFVNFTHTLQD